jgi:hypothetical protein
MGGFASLLRELPQRGIRSGGPLNARGLSVGRDQFGVDYGSSLLEENLEAAWIVTRKGKNAAHHKKHEYDNRHREDEQP